MMNWGEGEIRRARETRGTRRRGETRKIDPQTINNKQQTTNNKQPSELVPNRD
jgi:hypothetical protein